MLPEIGIAALPRLPRLTMVCVLGALRKIARDKHPLPSSPLRSPDKAPTRSRGTAAGRAVPCPVSWVRDRRCLGSPGSKRRGGEGAEPRGAGGTALGVILQQLLTWGCSHFLSKQGGAGSPKAPCSEPQDRSGSPNKTPGSRELTSDR